MDIKKENQINLTKQKVQAKKAVIKKNEVNSKPTQAPVKKDVGRPNLRMRSVSRGQLTKGMQPPRLGMTV